MQKTTQNQELLTRLTYKIMSLSEPETEEFICLVEQLLHQLPLQESQDLRRLKA